MKRQIQAKCWYFTIKVMIRLIRQLNLPDKDMLIKEAADLIGECEKEIWR
jgi:hypothetical protein